VLLHTHLDGHHGWLGAKAKIWAIENWVALVGELHGRGCDVSLIEWNVAAAQAIRSHCPYIRDVTEQNLSALCHNMRLYDCIVSVDSWVKYAAEWNHVPQVVIVPDLRSGYTPDFAQVTADWVAQWWFHGLIGKPRVTVLGLARSRHAFVYTLPTLEELRPSEVLRAISVQLSSAATP